MPQVMMIDPPQGWMHGFPKPLPEDISPGDTKDWLISEGYPKELAENMPYCRQWMQESSEVPE